MLLKKDAVRLFSFLGFSVKTDTKVRDQDVEVYAVLDEHKIIIECRHTGISKPVNVRGLIRKWGNKLSELGDSRVIIIIYGEEIKPSLKAFAKSLGITLWGENDFEKIFDMTIEDKKRGMDYVSKLLKEDIKVEKKAEITPTKEKRYEMLAEALKKMRVDGDPGKAKLGICVGGVIPGFMGADLYVCLDEIGNFYIYDKIGNYDSVEQYEPYRNFKKLIINEDWISADDITYSKDKDFEKKVIIVRVFKIFFEKKVDKVIDAIEKIFKVVHNLPDNYTIGVKRMDDYSLE